MNRNEFEFQVHPHGMNATPRAKSDMALLSFHENILDPIPGNEYNALSGALRVAGWQNKTGIDGSGMLIVPPLFVEYKKGISGRYQLEMAFDSVSRQLELLGLEEIHIFGIAVDVTTNQVKFMAMAWDRRSEEGKVCVSRF